MVLKIFKKFIFTVISIVVCFSFMINMCGASTTDVNPTVAENAKTQGTSAMTKAMTKVNDFSKNRGIVEADTNPAEIIGIALNVVLGIIGIAALFMFLYGAIIFMLSEGNAEKVTTAKKTMVWATLGLVAIFMSYYVIDYLFDALLIINN